SQPGLSLMMREMESRLDCQLFERTTRSGELTEVGRRFLVRAQRVIDELDSVAPALNQASAEQRRTLHVAATPVFSASVMPHVHKRLRALHPTVSLQLVDVPKPEVETLVRSDAVDCGLGIFAKRLAELGRESLFKFDFAYVESRAEPLLFTHEPPSGRLAWQDLPETPFVELSPTSELQQLINRCKKKAGKPQSPGFIFNNLETLIGMAASGVGPTIVPTFAISASARLSTVTALLDRENLPLDFHLISRKGRAQPAVMEIFREVLLDVINERRV